MNPCNLMSLFNAAARNDLPPITLIAVHDFADTDGVTRYDIFIEASSPNTSGFRDADEEQFEGAVRKHRRRRRQRQQRQRRQHPRPQGAIEIYHDGERDGDKATQAKYSGNITDNATDDELDERRADRWRVQRRYNEFRELHRLALRCGLRHRTAHRVRRKGSLRDRVANPSSSGHCTAVGTGASPAASLGSVAHVLNGMPAFPRKTFGRASRRQQQARMAFFDTFLKRLILWRALLPSELLMALHQLLKPAVQRQYEAGQLSASEYRALRAADRRALDLDLDLGKWEWQQAEQDLASRARRSAGRQLRRRRAALRDRRRRSSITETEYNTALAEQRRAIATLSHAQWKRSRSLIGLADLGEEAEANFSATLDPADSATRGQCRRDKAARRRRRRLDSGHSQHRQRNKSSLVSPSGRGSHRLQRKDSFKGSRALQPSASVSDMLALDAAAFGTSNDGGRFGRAVVSSFHAGGLSGLGANGFGCDIRPLSLVGRDRSLPQLENLLDAAVDDGSDDSESEDYADELDAWMTSDEEECEASQEGHTRDDTRLSNINAASAGRKNDKENISGNQRSESSPADTFVDSDDDVAAAQPAPGLRVADLNAARADSYARAPRLKKARARAKVRAYPQTRLLGSSRADANGAEGNLGRTRGLSRQESWSFVTVSSYMSLASLLEANEVTDNAEAASFSDTDSVSELLSDSERDDLPRANASACSCTCNNHTSTHHSLSDCDE